LGERGGKTKEFDLFSGAAVKKRRGENGLKEEGR